MMMMSGRSGGGGGAGRYPFTASQWQELEHQALIYKYMASGTPVPSDLILPLRRSFLLDSALATSPSLAFPPQPSQLGWGCFGMGFGRKAEDPEPGRCRRTDGKKWRCSKEAYPDSKYCEKHMHRGKNRSRKPVEMSLATPPPSSTSSASSAATTSPSSYRPSPLSISTSGPDAPAYHLLPPYASSARPSSHSPFHAQMSPFHLHLDTTHAPPPPPPSSYYSSVDHKDYRYAHGARELDEHAFFSDGSERDQPSPWQFKHLGAEPKQGAPLFPGGYGNTTTTSPYAIDLSKDNEDKERQQQHCFVLGADLRLEKPSGRADDAPPQKPPRHNFFDEWPHEKSKRSSWMGLEGETQLSISIPAMAADLPITTTSRFHNDE